MAKSNLLKGKTPDVISANVKTLMESGKHTHASALRCAMCHANKNHSKTAARISKKVATKGPAQVTVK